MLIKFPCLESSFPLSLGQQSSSRRNWVASWGSWSCLPQQNLAHGGDTEPCLYLHTTVWSQLLLPKLPT